MADTANYVALNPESLISFLYYTGQFGTTPDLITSSKEVIEEILDKYVPEEKRKELQVLPLQDAKVKDFMEKSQFGTLYVESCEAYDNLESAE